MGGGGSGANGSLPCRPDWGMYCCGSVHGPLYPNPLPVPHPSPPQVTASSRCSSLGGMVCGTCRGQAERAKNRSIDAIRKLHAMYSRGHRRRPAATLLARPCARLEWAGRVLGVVKVGQAVVLARRPYTLGAPPATGGEVKADSDPPVACVGVRHAGEGREKGGVWGHCCPGGRGHATPEWCCPAAPGGRVALGLCVAPGIPARGERGARPQAEPTPPPPNDGSGPKGGGKEVGGRGEGGGATSRGSTPRPRPRQRSAPSPG